MLGNNTECIYLQEIAHTPAVSAAVRFSLPMRPDYKACSWYYVIHTTLLLQHRQVSKSDLEDTFR